MAEGAASTNRSPLVERAVAAAEDHLRAGREDEAALLYELALSARPGHAAAREGLAEIDGVRLPPEPAPAVDGAASEDGSPGPAVPPRGLPWRVARRIGRPALEGLAQGPRIWKYRALSTCRRVHGSPILLQPVLFAGMGEVVLGDGVQFGWHRSPLFYTGYCHVEVSQPQSRIELGDRTEFNNNAFLKSEGPGIRVGADGLFGAHVEIFDSNFHDLHPARRHGGTPRMAPVDIGANVFAGMGVRILKGVTVGADTVIGAGAVVTSDLPAGVIAAGNPARPIREL